MDSLALDLATKTLAQAIDSLMAKGSPFVPIVVVQRGSERELQRIVAGRVEDAAATAKQVASAQTDADAAAFAIDAAIPYNGTRFDAIVVESWNFLTNKGARIGLRYEMKGRVRKKPSLIGSPLHLGRGGWFDPEDGEPDPVPTFPEIVRDKLSEPAVVPSVAPPVVGFGPPPAPDALAPADVAPPPPSAIFEAPQLPRSFTEQISTNPGPLDFPPPPPPRAADDFGPPPTSAAVAFDPPPGYESAAAPAALNFPPPVLTPAPAPLIEAAPPAAAHPVAPVVVPEPAPQLAAVPVPEPVPVPEYVPVPIQRSETPLGNRAMFAGVMEMATKGRSFPAFAIVQKDGAWEQVTMTDANLADTPASVRAYARSRTDAEFIAFAVDAFVTVDGVDVTAVVVEVWEYSTRVSFSVAQRYVPTGDPPSPRLSGRPLMRTPSGWVDVPSSMMLGGQVQFAYSEPGAS